MLDLILYGGPIVATMVQMFKNNMAKNIIEREGYIITEENRSVSEVVSSFIKDYFYILIPGYNLYRAFKLFTKSDKEYAHERRNKLSSYERITQAKKEEVKKVESKKEVKPVEVKKPIQVNESTKKASIINDIGQLIDEIACSNDIEFLTQVKKEYKLKSALLRDEHKNKKLSGASVSELNKIVSKIKIYDRVFIEARDRLMYIKSQQINKYYSK